MKLGIIGLGIVGGTYHACYKFQGLDVKGYDKYVKSDVKSVKDLFDRDAIFLCLPTICKTNGEIDLTPYEETMPKLKKYKGVTIIRSTLTPGTTAEYEKKYNLEQLIHCPEFLTEKNRLADFFMPSRILIGSNHKKLDKSIEDALFKSFNVPIIYGTTTETELAKYASNIFLALKITYANEFYEICKVHGVQWEKVKAMMIDSRINTKHMSVTRERGYGGMCFPKDVKQMIQHSIKKGYFPGLLIEMDKSNDIFRGVGK